MGGVVVFCLMTLRGYGVIVFWVLMRFGGIFWKFRLRLSVNADIRTGMWYFACMAIEQDAWKPRQY